MVKKQRIGIVVRAKAKKSIVVATQMKYQHKKYIKTLIKTKRCMAHDEENLSRFGDLVLIEESKPFSKEKKWLLKEIIKSNNRQK
jgi:small subunit ribosomal protein S17